MSSCHRCGHPVHLQAFPDHAVPEWQVAMKRRAKSSVVRLFPFLPWPLVQRQLPPVADRTRRRLLKDPCDLGHLSNHASSDPRRLIDLPPTFGRRTSPWAAELAEPPPPSTPKMDSPGDGVAAEPVCPPSRTAVHRLRPRHRCSAAIERTSTILQLGVKPDWPVGRLNAQPNWNSGPF
jgi:hypothetical protein